jgi:ATP-binding cassette subfamily C (CFTR/MRP) protein 1
MQVQSNDLGSFPSSDNLVMNSINTDVQRITVSLQRIDDLFANPVEIAVAIFLLYRQVGVSCVAPVALSTCISCVSFLTSNNGIKVRASDS